MSNRLLLPHDLQNEILVRLPVKSLLRFQGVCKSWKSFFSSPRFISKHTQYSESKDNYAHLLHWHKYDKDGVKQYQLHHIDGSFNEFQKLEYPCQIRGRDYGLVLDCKGLIFFKTIIKHELDDHGFESLILWNPAIRMSISLPRPSIDVSANNVHRVHGFGFDHKSNDYKVVRIVYERYSSFSPKAEMYKLSAGFWETVRVADDFMYTIYPYTQAFVNGAIHWFGNHERDRASSCPECVVVLFHMCDEEFQVMKFPDRLISSLKENYVEIGVYGGLLSLMEYNPQQYINFSCNIWLMKDYGVAESWTKQFTIDLKGQHFGPVFSFQNNEKILWVRQEKPVLYDSKTHKFINLEIKAEGFLFAKNTFVESLVLLNEVNVIQTCQTCLRKGRCTWCNSKKGKEKKRKRYDDIMREKAKQSKAK